MIFCSAVLVLWACKKNDPISPTASPAGMAYIKIAEFSPNFRQVVNGRDSFNVYVNGAKLNGTFLTYGGFFPSTTDLYAAVPAGAQSIRVTINGINAPDSGTLATITKTLAANSYYSFLLTDSLLTANESKQIFVQDNFVRTDTSHYTIRFVNAVLNDTAGKNVDIYSTRLAANMFTNQAPGTATAFISVPYTLVSDTLIARRPGTTFELARYTTVSVPLARERAYTLIYKGTPGSTTGTKGRSLVTYTNQ